MTLKALEHKISMRRTNHRKSPKDAHRHGE